MKKCPIIKQKIRKISIIKHLLREISSQLNVYSYVDNKFNLPIILVDNEKERSSQEVLSTKVAILCRG
jgi:hypothetical protein